METADYKLCPSCKKRNQADAFFCQYCGRPFESSHDPFSTTTEVEKPKLSFQEKIDKADRPAPEEGIAVYILGRSNPIAVVMEDEFIIGRAVDPINKKIVDFTEYDGFALGVSRQHLLVRRVEDGYQVVDLHSRNGTWVNDRSLAPETPLAIKSGSRISLGSLRIFLVYRQQGMSKEPEQSSHEQAT